MCAVNIYTFNSLSLLYLLLILFGFNILHLYISVSVTLLLMFNLLAIFIVFSAFSVFELKQIIFGSINRIWNVAFLKTLSCSL